VKWVISGIIMFILGFIGSLSPGWFNWFYRVVGTQGAAIILAIVVPLLIALILSHKYILDIFGRKLDIITGVLIKLAEQAGIKIGEEIQSPGYVYTACRWLRIGREEVIDGVHHIYVYCAHPKNPMTIHGCPMGCPYLDTSDRPTGSGAFAGLVLGGLAGLILGGPPGVIIGGLLGAVIGNTLEVTKPVQTRIIDLRNRGVPFQIHIDERYISK